MTLICPICGNDVPEVEEDQLEVTCETPSCGVQLEHTGEGVWENRSLGLSNDYSTFVLPFAIRGSYGDIVRTLDKSSRWARRLFSNTNPEDVERTAYFLPYIRRFLFPALFSKDARDDVSTHFEFDLAHLPSTQMRVTGIHSHRETRFVCGSQISAVSLRMFSFGVGFLAIRVNNREGSDYFEQMAMLSHVRLLEPLFMGFEMPKLELGGVSIHTPQLVRYLLDEFSDHPGKLKTLDAVSPDERLPVKLIYDDRMLVYGFSLLDRNSVGENGRDLERWIYRETPLRVNTARLDDPEAPRKRWIFKRWEGQSKDGAVLVAIDSNDFHRDYLGLYQETYYFDIFLLACLQRITLLLLFERLSDIPGLTKSGMKSRKRIQRVQRDLLEFKNQCWFSQITNRDKGLEVWRRWQSVFETETLLKEVNEQSTELDNFLRRRTRERAEWLMRTGAFLAATVPIVFALDEIFGDTAWVGYVKTWGLIGLVTGCGMFALVKTIRHSRQ